MISISSSQNTHIKQLKNLQEKSRLRRKSGTFVIEGEKEILMAMDAGYVIDSFFLRVNQPIHPIFSAKFNQTKQYLLTEDLFERLCYREKTTKILAICQSKEHSLNQVRLNSQNPLLLLTEAPEKPGNIGALLRSSDAFGVDLVVIIDPKTDLYNPNIIRSSVGCVFGVNTVTASLNETLEYLKANSIDVFSAALTQQAIPYTQANFNKSTAIVVGTENNGLSSRWLHDDFKQIFIPMSGINDSLNVSVAAGILLAEVIRQRNL